MIKGTLLAHIRNEEYLLPQFLRHHSQIFSDGIIIDYHSTDRSVEIVKEICPHWQVITSRNENFQADNIDYEVMDIEKNITGWRICLNVTELLIGDYSVLTDAPGQLLIPSLFMVDTDRERQIDITQPLYEQKVMALPFIENFRERRARSIHNYPVQYPVPGRHYETYTTTDLVIFYYGWCPINKQTLERKLQIQTQIPLIDRQRHWGFHHITNEETLLYKLDNEFIPKAINSQKEINEYVRKHKNSTDVL